MCWIGFALLAIYVARLARRVSTLEHGTEAELILTSAVVEPKTHNPEEKTHGRPRNRK